MTKPKMKSIKPKTIVNFPSDKSGCGMYRTILPFEYLINSQDFNCPFLFDFNFDKPTITRANWIRFQRNGSEAHKELIYFYKRTLIESKSSAKIAYDLDDIFHEISPSNPVAYMYYTPVKQKCCIEIMKVCDMVTASTQFIKDYYKHEHDVNNIEVIPNYLPKYLWGRYNNNECNIKKKPRILWSGSGSHVLPGGDFDFLVPLVLKTLDEFEWVFHGCHPPMLNGLVKTLPWTDLYSLPADLADINADVFIAPIADSVFNYGKSDLKLLEASAIGLPCICSTIGNQTGPYDLVKGAFCVENTTDAWYDAIKQHVTDEATWNATRQAGINELNKRWLENNIDRYIELYK